MYASRASLVREPAPNAECSWLVGGKGGGSRKRHAWSKAPGGLAHSLRPVCHSPTGCFPSSPRTWSRTHQIRETLMLPLWSSRIARKPWCQTACLRCDKRLRRASFQVPCVSTYVLAKRGAAGDAVIVGGCSKESPGLVRHLCAPCAHVAPPPSRRPAPHTNPCLWLGCETHAGKQQRRQGSALLKKHRHRRHKFVLCSQQVSEMVT